MPRSVAGMKNALRILTAALLLLVAIAAMCPNRAIASAHDQLIAPCRVFQLIEERPTVREETSDVVLVYQYLYWDDHAQIRKLSGRYATFDAIKDGLGIPLYASGKIVARTEVTGGIWNGPA